MRRRPLAVGLALVMLAAACGGGSRSSPAAGSGTTSAAAIAPEETSYADRLAMTKALATRYPGTTDPEPTLGRFGLWAGILVQTEWQQSSHRDRLASWNLMNSSLTVVPTLYTEDLEAAPGSIDQRCATNGFVRADPGPSSDDLPDRAAVCRAWMRYFEATQQHESSERLDRLLWEAHTESLMSTLLEHPSVLDRSSTREEQNFLASWLEIVLLLAALEFPTVATTSVPAREAVMPNCAPIGSEGCSVSRSDLGRAYEFTSTLADHPVSNDKIISLYKMGKSNPAALIASVGSDVSIASALQAYLSAAGWSPTGFLPFPTPN